MLRYLLPAILVLATTITASAEQTDFQPIAPELAGQVEYYLERLADCVATEEDYTDFSDRLVRDAETLKVLFVAFSSIDDLSPQKEAADYGKMMRNQQLCETLFTAADGVAKAKDYAAAKAAVAALQKALVSPPPATKQKLTWDKTANIDALMAQVPLVESRMRRVLKPSRFESKATEAAGYTATLIAIGQASWYDTSKAKDDAQKALWQKDSAAMQAAGMTVLTSFRAKDLAKTEAAYATLKESCTECHKTFAPDQE